MILSDIVDIIHIHCDGGCSVHTTKIGGYGIVLRCGAREKHIWGFAENTTNNQMELMGAITGLQAVIKKDIETLVTTDSKYVVEGINSWVDKWYLNDWRTAKKKPVKNCELWQILYNEKEKFQNITFEHCYGHKDNKYNNIADSLATKAISTKTNGSILC